MSRSYKKTISWNSPPYKSRKSIRKFRKKMNNKLRNDGERPMSFHVRSKLQTEQDYINFAKTFFYEHSKNRATLYNDIIKKFLNSGCNKKKFTDDLAEEFGKWLYKMDKLK